MKFSYILKLSTKSFMQRKLRSWLTILGIVIGVAAVVTILSLGESMQQSIESQLGDLGADVITVRSGYSRASIRGFGEHRTQTTTFTDQKNITNRDIQIIKSISGAQYVNGVASGMADVAYLSESAPLLINGGDPIAWKEITTSELASGRYLTQNDGNVVVIGSSVANDMFKEPLSLSSQINVEGVSFKIVGILEESGGFGSGDDRTVFMPYDSAILVLEDMDADCYNYLEVKVSNEEMVEETMEEIDRKLMLSRHVTERTKDFTVSSSLQTIETISEITSTISLFLAGIAAISLLVGAIGIANTTFMSVIERTKQIGILKALGTTNFEIMKLFLTESATIGFAGGLVGIFLAFILIGIMSEMGFSMTMGRMGSGTIATITPELIIFALGFSTVIGIISGLIPARMASRLQPTEALRYE